MLESLNQQVINSPALYTIELITIEETRAKLLSEYHEFLDIFNRLKADKLPLYRPYNYKIKLEGEE